MKKCTLLAACMAFFLQMAAQSNLGFENWNGSDPASWTTSNELSMDGGGIQTAFRETSNPGQGNSSLKLVTGSCPECPNFGLGFMTLPFPDPIGGFVELGEIGDEGIPYTKRPISVDFMYKSNPMPNDACGFYVELTRYNSQTEEDEIVGECYFETSATVDEWTNINIPFVYASELQPEKMNIFITSSIGSVPDYSAIFPWMPSPGSLGLPVPVAGSEFYVDAIVFNMPSCADFNITVTANSEEGTASVTAMGGTPPYQYLWNTLETTPTIENLIPGRYSVLVTDANDCQRVGTCNIVPEGCRLSIYVTGTNSTTNSIYSGTGSATVHVTDGNPPYNYTWNNGETTATINNLPIGTYSVLVEEVNNPMCVMWGFYTVYGPNGPNGVGSEFTQTITLCPNPTSDYVQIDGDVNIDEICIYDLSGKLVGKLVVDNTCAELNVSNLPSGIYLIKLHTEKGVLEKKIVKQ